MESWTRVLIRRRSRGNGTRWADGLCAVRPDLDRADLERRLEKENSQYEVLLTNVEEGEAEAIRAFIEEHKTAYYLYLTPSTKRYYPFSALASQVLGFVNTEGGVYGLEAGYEDVLKGIPGRVVTGKQRKMWRCTTATPTISTRSTAMT